MRRFAALDRAGAGGGRAVAKRTSLLSIITLLGAAMAAVAAPAAAGRAEEALRAFWVGRLVVLRPAVQTNCDERYTNNRMRGTQASSGGIHRLAPGELGRIDALHVQRARIDLLVTVVEPLRLELRDGPFRLFEHRQCRVELEVPAPREAVRRGDVDRLEAVVGGVLDGSVDRTGAEASPAWNRRRVEPLPEDHEETLAAYRAWKEEQLYLALRGRLAEALDRAADLAAGAERGTAYARGLAAGARDFDPDRLFSAACGELPGTRLSGGWEKPPADLDDDDQRDWKDGYQDGRRLRFELALARRIERCLP